MGAGVFLLLSAIAAALGGRPLYRAAKEARARAAAVRGEALLRSGSLDPGMHQLRVAFQLAPQDPEVLRIVARTSAQTGNPEAAGFFRSLMEMGAATLEDRLMAAELFLRGGERDSSGKLVQALTREVPKDPRAWRLAIEHSGRFSSLRDSIALARNVVARFPGEAEFEFELGRFLSTSPRSADREPNSSAPSPSRGFRFPRRASPRS